MNVWTRRKKRAVGRKEEKSGSDKASVCTEQRASLVSRCQSRIAVVRDGLVPRSRVCVVLPLGGAANQAWRPTLTI
jgi:hypothetical protein